MDSTSPFYDVDRYSNKEELLLAVMQLEQAEITVRNSFTIFQMSASIFIWIIGVFGNVLNILIFTSKFMADKPINSLFACLAVSDLIVLILYAVNIYLYSYNFSLQIGVFMPNDNREIPNVIASFLLVVLHTITVGLNISLALWRYLGVANPFLNRTHLNNQSSQLFIFVTFFISFALCLPLLLICTIDFDGILLSTSPTDDPALTSDDNLFIWINYYQMGLRIGLFVLLVVISIMLIFAVMKVDRLYWHTSVDSTHSTGRRKPMDQINVLVIMILIVFIITEVPYSCICILRKKMYDLLIDALDVVPSEMKSIMLSYKVNEVYINIVVVGRLLQLALLINSSCNVFFYLTMSTSYRKTLQLLFHETFHLGHVAPRDENNDTELHQI